MNHAADLATIAALFSGQRTLTCPRTYIELTGNFKAGFLLSQIVYWSQNPTAQKRGGWFYKSWRDWQEELCFTRAEADCATRRLEALDLIETYVGKAEGAPTRWYRLKIEPFALAVRRLLADKEETRATPGDAPIAENQQSNAENRQSWNAENQQSTAVDYQKKTALHAHEEKPPVYNRSAEEKPATGGEKKGPLLYHGVALLADPKLEAFDHAIRTCTADAAQLAQLDTLSEAAWYTLEGMARQELIEELNDLDYVPLPYVRYRMLEIYERGTPHDTEEDDYGPQETDPLDPDAAGTP